MASENIEQVLCGAVKYARKQDYRDRVTRFGLAAKGRHVVAEFPDYPQKEKGVMDEVDESLQFSALVKYVRGRIRRHTNCSRYIKLIDEVIVKGRCNAEVAAKLGINAGTARSVVSRARKQLSLRK